MLTKKKKKIITYLQYKLQTTFAWSQKRKTLLTMILKLLEANIMLALCPKFEHLLSKRKKLIFTHSC